MRAPEPAHPVAATVKPVITKLDAEQQGNKTQRGYFNGYDPEGVNPLHESGHKQRKPHQLHGLVASAQQHVGDHFLFLEEKRLAHFFQVQIFHQRCTQKQRGEQGKKYLLPVWVGPKQQIESGHCHCLVDQLFHACVSAFWFFDALNFARILARNIVGSSLFFVKMRQRFTAQSSHATSHSPLQPAWVVPSWERAQPCPSK